jgi:hypothetical protein
MAHIRFLLFLCDRYYSINYWTARNPPMSQWVALPPSHHRDKAVKKVVNRESHKPVLPREPRPNADAFLWGGRCVGTRPTRTRYNIRTRDSSVWRRSCVETYLRNTRARFRVWDRRWTRPDLRRRWPHIEVQIDFFITESTLNVTQLL